MKKLIKKIHSEFSTSSDILLKEAQKVVEKESKNISKYDALKDKADRLEKAGFVNSEDVIYKKAKVDRLQRDLEANNELTELILYYKRTYPFQKFLTEDELERICDKYKLVYAPVGNYIKTVPKKNLKEIENSDKLLKKDKVDFFYKLKGNKEFKVWMKKIGFPDCSFTRNQLNEKVREHYGRCPYEWDEPHKSTTGLFVISEKIEGNYIFNSCTVIEKTGLFIAAPKTHFNNLKKLGKNKRGFFRIEVAKYIPDPIVFRYCRGGIQVLTMWGDENFDPNKEFGLVNEINN